MIAVAVGIMIVIIITAAYVVFKDNLPETDENGDKPVSFTFFDVGANTPLTESLRETLRDRLGSDAIETQTTVNLEILYKDFIREYLPEIYKLNRLLNGDAGQRIEYNTIKLRYRYIPQENYPFDYVEFLFSNYSQKPIYCKIQSKKEGKAIIDVLKKKYGAPRRIEMDGKHRYSLIWQYKGDILVYASTPDRFGNPGYQIMIYYVDNIKELLINDKAMKKKQLKDTIEKVF
jgi:hypothetical protein